MTIYEGTIVTCDRRNSVYRFLAEDKGRIVMAGEHDPVTTGLEGAARATRVRLGSRAVVPAFGDTHIHFCSWSFFLSCIDVRGCTSNLEVIARLTDPNPQGHASKPLLAFGASGPAVKERKLICREELDEALPARPVMVFKYDGHACVCNSAMLRALPNDIRHQGGFHGDSGELNQQAFFSASAFVTRGISPFRLVRGMMQGYEVLASRGLGMIHSAEGVGFPRDMDIRMALLMARGVKSPFRTRLFFQTMEVDRVVKRRLPRVGGCFATALDGAFGTQDAALREPYACAPKSRGVLYYAQQQVNNFCIRANRAGLQIAMHAIGDAAIDQALTALKAALADTPRKDHRHIIIHACMAARDQLEECARLGIGIAAQSAFLNWPEEPDWYLERLLGKRADGLLPLRSMRQAGVHVSFGSDAPCTVPDPLLWIHNACNHPNSDQSVSVQDALTMLTREAAWMSFDDKETGSLEPGKWADMVILDRNPLTAPKETLKSIAVEKLLLKGKPWAGVGTLPGVVFRGLV